VNRIGLKQLQGNLPVSNQRQRNREREALGRQKQLEDRKQDTDGRDGDRGDPL